MRCSSWALIGALFIAGFFSSILYSLVALVLAIALCNASSCRQEASVFVATVLFIITTIFATTIVHADLALHLIAGALIAAYFSEHLDLAPLLIIVLVFGVMWEAAELFAWLVIGLPGYVASPADTALDLVMDVLGAFFFLKAQQYIFKCLSRE